VIGIGESVPDVRVRLAPREEVGLRELTGEAGYLLLFYIFDWSST
jgi:hypothetical protein